MAGADRDVPETESATGSEGDPPSPQADRRAGERGAVAEVHPGDHLGRYAVGELLGAGGMGRVFAAVDSALGRTVALKVIRSDREAGSPHARSRLLREAQALARLHHPNVVTVHEVGTEAEHLFVAMELVEGQTLAAWLKAEPRGWRAVRDAFVAAGQGLAAAHAAGIVHRDFKPHNVIVGTDRVVVVDFGLARAEGEETERVMPDSRPNLEMGITTTGDAVGTPFYMAPEQRAGGPVDAKADQYAFCVALHAALYHRPPAEGAPLPSAPGVPRFVGAAVLRGVARRPEDRWPSMAELLAALGRTFWTGPRKRLAAGGALAFLVALTGVAFTVGEHAATADPCAGGEALVAPLWDDAARTRVRDAFAKTGRPYAEDTFARVDAALRDRLAVWARAHGEACAATEVRHEQAAELLDRRMDCLGQARREIAVLVGLLAEADGAMLDRAAQAARSAGDVTACADTAALREIMPPPRDPVSVVEIGGEREELARLQDLRRLGKTKDGLAAAAALLERTRRLGYAPVLAAALYHDGLFEVDGGQLDAALDHFYEAAKVAGDAGDASIAAEAFSGAERILGSEKRHFEAADVAYRSALAAAARARNPPAVMAVLVKDHAMSLDARGAYAAELPFNLLGLALNASVNGARSREVLNSLADLARNTDEFGNQADALTLLRRALGVSEEVAGPEHPTTLMIWNNIGWELLGGADFEGAARIFERLLPMSERTYGRDLPEGMIVPWNLGIAYRELRRLNEARDLLERVIRVDTEKLGPEHPYVAWANRELAAVARLEGRTDEALADLEKAKEIYRKAVDAPPDVVADTYRADADLLRALGRLPEARAAIDEVTEIEAKTPTADHVARADALRIAADLEVSEKHPRAAIPSYRRAIAIIEESNGEDSPKLVEPLTGLSAALVQTDDPPGALAAADRAVAIAVAHRLPADREGVAQLRVAQARWALDQDRSAALVLARTTRARLAALPYPAEILPEIDRWISGRR